MLEMQVSGICRCSRHPMPTIVLRSSDGTRLLAIGISAAETERIAHELHCTSQCQPSIYTLARQVLATSGDARRVVLWLDIRDETLVGGVEFVRRGVRTSLDCAPRDVAVLAAQLAVPLLIRDALAAHLEQTGEPTAAHDAGTANLAGWLDRVRPQDFS